MTPHLRRRVTMLTAAATAAMLALTSLTANPASAEPAQLIANGDFATGTTGWWSTDNAPISAAGGELCADVPGGTTNAWDVSLGYNDVPLVAGAAYRLSFRAHADAPVTVRANVQLNEDPYTAALSRSVALTTAAQTFDSSFTSSLQSANGTLTFQLGGSAQAFRFCLDDVSLTSDTAAPPAGAEQLENGDFSDGTAGWYSYGTTATGVDDGQLCTTVPGGLANPWDAGIGQNNVTLQAGSAYTLSFDATASPGATVRAAVQLGADPYTSYLSRDVALTPARQHLEYTFTASEDTTAGQVAFQVGGAAAEYRLCLDNVSLTGGEAEPPYVPDTGPRVRVNQVGYLPAGPKNATLVTDATTALDWQLKNAAGSVVRSGRSTPRGVDAASGQNVHTIDFTGYTTAGTGYTLVADGQTSHPFDISGTVYERLRPDALQFFYIQRSGIAIDGGLVGEQYARPAGHLGVAPNKGDTDVPCRANTCDYRLDVRGGWYDAGDQGKYVVNGGIAVQQLMSSFERTKTAVTAAHGAGLADSTLRVPERGNKVPDILDEARWELEFLMRMQVPAGQPLAGMAHHKMHDANWTGLPMQPQDDPEQRELQPPSTAATLNLAATTAQCARLFAPYDATFAAKCLTVARTAYAAAKANPAKLAQDLGGGGGSYGDDDVSDEFYWAAAELYLTTGEAAFLTDVTASRHHTGDVFAATGFGWASTAALGRLDLATVPSALPAADRERVRQSVLTAADGYLATVGAQAYGLPMPGNAGAYFWGANSNILNNVQVLATAFDMTGAAKYRDAAVQGVDYIFGRNALNQSYVTGWGEKASENQHTRIYAHEKDAALPHPPAGSLAGGANAGLDDPYAKSLLTGCKPMFCYVDDIESYATNELAINWNSALAWVASFLADQGRGEPAAAVSCRATYTNYGDWADKSGFTAQLAVTNTGTKAIDGWAVRFAFLGGQKVRDAWSAEATQSGATVTAKNLAANQRIQPGATVYFGFNATTPGGPNPAPELITLNGSACGRS
ncbi:glycoside hydrolase family 9 protein [Actinoplanes sp. N902-109]|uniref:glycoside hydrolase family 9 protein n=1 Tax=Actinoplanes sp. (strain N902-109) TaxID=649831 RepID=UPI0003293885|nr:glycoside hydrolase family 9 protein [Actinoplanes sp. N902-109]AGL16685.1 glycoside hydrolase family protein [Actinoplanes sp. N902-109]